MRIFSRKRKVTPQKMASEMWGALVQIMQHEFDESSKFNRVKFLAEEGWDYDKKRYVEESSFIYTFLIRNEISRFFPEKKEAILAKFDSILEKNDMGFLLEGIKEYEKTWESAVTREHETNDESLLNNPIYCISKLASVRCLKEHESIDGIKLIMFSSRINAFTEWLAEEFERYEVT
jgi:hypothetical protein